MRKIISSLLLASIILAGIAGAAKIDPKEDILTRDADGAYIEIFGIDAWISDAISFPDPTYMENGTIAIGKGISPGAEE